MGLRGRSAAGTRSWLGSNSRLRTYGSRSTYGSPTWKRQPSRPLGGLQAPSSLGQVRKEPTGEQSGESGSAVFEILSDDSEDETGVNPPRLGGVGGIDGGSSSVEGSGVTPRSCRDSMAATTATSSGFDVGDWSDSSNERPAKKSSRKGTEARSARVPTCQLQTLTSRRGGAGGGGGAVNSNDDIARSEDQPRRPRSPSPPPAAAKAKSRSPSPPRGVGPRSGWFNKGNPVSHAAPAATAAAATIGARKTIGQRPGPTIGDVSSRPSAVRSSKSKDACERRVGVRLERSLSPVAFGRPQGRGAGAMNGRPQGRDTGAMNAPVGSGGGARARVGGFNEPATRRVLGVEGSDREGKGIAEKTAGHSVFDMDDDDSD